MWNHHVLLCYIKAWGLFFLIYCLWWDNCTFSLIYFFIFLSFEREVHVGKVSPWASFSAVIQRKNTEECCMKCSPEKLQIFFFFYTFRTSSDKFFVTIDSSIFLSFHVKSASVRLVSVPRPPCVGQLSLYGGFGCITRTFTWVLLSKWSLQSYPGLDDEVAYCQDTLMVYAGSHKEPEREMGWERQTVKRQVREMISRRYSIEIEGA